jgi:hypothetical protein
VAAENDNSTSRFELDGRKYDVPDFVDLDLNDWEIVYDECGVVLADFQQDDDDKKEAARLERIRNPRLEKAFVMVALRRARPDDEIAALREEAGRIKLLPYLSEVAGGETEDPPTSAMKPEPSSKESSGSNSESSSPPSPSSSATPESRLAAIGTDG